MTSTASRSLHAEGEPEAKRPKVAGDSMISGVSERVELNPADCNLDFNVEQNGLQGHALYDGGFAYCWSGARANIGITGGKYCFGCKIISQQPVHMEDTPPAQQHVCRVGISRGDDNVGSLGESEHSFGFGGTGKFSNSGKFSDYGTKFGVGDTIVCSVDLESKPLAVISFSKNGQCLGTAKQFDAGPRGLQIIDSVAKTLAWKSALFPHVLLKNVLVQMQFSIEDGLVPEEGYKPWNCAVQERNMISGPTFLGPEDREVIMMVGLPASGKTTWAEKWIKDHPEKRYILLGTNPALDQMKVPGLLRKHNYGERFDRLMDRATGIFNTLLARAAKTPRNYILDQTNVYKSARKRKLKAFINCRKIAVVIFPTPQDLKNRAERRFKEMGKEVPAEAVNEMLANYVLPTSKDMPGTDEMFDEILFPELNREDSQKHLDEMKHELRSPLKPTDVSPYSREGSVQSFSRFGPPNMISTGAPGSPNFHSPFPRPDPNFPCPQQARSYSGSELYERSGPPPGGYSPGFSTSSHAFPRDHPYGTNSRYGSSLARDDSYGGYRGSDTYNASRFRSPMSSLSYDGRTGPSGDFRLPHESLPAETMPPVRLQSPSPMSAGPPPIHSYGDLPYGSPYGTPPPKRPYEDFSPRDSYSGLVHGTPPPTHPYGSGSPYGVQPQGHPYGGVRPAGSFQGSSPYEAPPPRQPYGNGSLPPPVGRYSGPYSSYTRPGSRF
ncbi:Heterogeneous nuclear ribonucleoU-like protein 1 [Nymphaea thermarum]|nr:Heterogeneous nuclear ribonucleoU-like protein 1 [Nymphaea thermarum]